MMSKHRWRVEVRILEVRHQTTLIAKNMSVERHSACNSSNSRLSRLVMVKQVQLLGTGCTMIFRSPIWVKVVHKEVDMDGEDTEEEEDSKTHLLCSL